MTEQKWTATSAGIKIPPFVYGTAWKKERTADLVVEAVRAGFRGIDTACQPKHYNEALVGSALQRLHDQGIERNALFLQTKFTPLSGQDPKKLPYDKDAAIESQVAQSFAASLKNLRTEYVDLLILHSPLRSHALTMRAWNAMEKIYLSGAARLLAISNCDDLSILEPLYRDAKVKPAVVQNRFYQATDYDQELRDWCSAHGVLYESFWTLTANAHVLGSDTVRTIARQLQKTEPQIFFRFLHQSNIIPLTGTTSRQHMEEDLDIFDFELSSDDFSKIHLLLGKT